MEEVGALRIHHPVSYNLLWIWGQDVVVKLTHIVGKDGYLRGPGALISNGETWSRINKVMMPEAQVVNSDSGRGNSRTW
jgi:hypothetical protein